VARPTATDTNARRPSLASERVLVAAIVAAAFLVRVAWIAYAHFTPTLSDDAGRYDLLGRSLAQAAGYINPNGTTTLFWPPGYPFILTAVYKLFGAGASVTTATPADSVRAALVLNALLASATVLLLYAIGRRAFGQRPAMLGALLYALLPSAIFYANVTLSETAFTFVLMLAVWLIIESATRRNWPLLIAAGVAVGYGSLIRGQAALLPVVALPFWWWMYGRPRRAVFSASKNGEQTVTAMRGVLPRFVLLSLVAAAVIAPWTIRNYVEAHSPVLIATNAGVDFYIGHSAGADGRGRIVNELVFRYPDLPEPEAEARVSNDGFHEGLSYAAHHPLREVSLSARKVFWLYYSDHEALRWTDGHGERHVLRAGVKSALTWTSDAYYWLVLAFALAGVRRWLSFSRDDAGAVRLLLVSLAVYWTLVHVAFFADPRFHAPIMGVVCLWAGVGASAMVQTLRTVATPARPRA
jgi:hypothetical protein